MHDKNDKLAKENNNLKTILSQRMEAQEELLKRSIKAEYNQILTYRQMLEVLDKSIESLEKALKDCRTIQESVIKNRRFLADKTNNQNLDSFKEIKDLIKENSKSSSVIKEFQIPKLDNNIKEKVSTDKDKTNFKEKIPDDFNTNKKKKLLLTEKDISIFNTVNRRKDKKGSNVKEDLFDSWDRN